MPGLSPLVTRRAIVLVAAITFVSVVLSFGLFFVVRTFDRPSASELSSIRQTLESFFRSYDMAWPSAEYGQPSLQPATEAVLIQQEKQLLQRTVLHDDLAEQIATERLESLRRARWERGAIITGSKRRIANIDYLRTTLEQTVVVRVTVDESRQEATWDPATNMVRPADVVEDSATYDISMHKTQQGWRVVGMRRAE